jgi:hypothetical protein
MRRRPSAMNSGLHRVVFLFVAWVAISTTACRWARPVTYSLPPGQSASFSPKQLEPSVAYAKTFCSVLSTEFKTWQACKDYVLMDTSYPAETMDDIPAGWTLLRIGGFGADCMAGTATAFEDAGQHLSDVHNVESLHLPVGPFDSSERNAVVIRDFVAGQAKTKKFIAVAHSKGAADMMVAFAMFPRKLAQVKAVITVAGAVGGSWLVDRLQKLNENILHELDLKCPADALKSGGPNAIDSMRRKTRQEFLAEHDPSPPLWFSISAVSTYDQTSKILQPLWARIVPHAKEQDSHIVEREAIVPWGTFLGRALGDHWAVATPFDPNPKVRPKTLRQINRNKFPREALVEAAVREALKKLAVGGS